MVKFAKALPEDRRPAIVWLRDDLRVSDHPALYSAVKTDAPVIVVYIHDEQSEGIRPKGAAQKWFLHQRLKTLAGELASKGGRLDLTAGKSDEILLRLAHATNAAGVYWLRRTESNEIALDQKIKSELSRQQIPVRSFNGNFLHEPSTFLTNARTPFKVYSAFWRAFEKQGTPRLPIKTPEQIKPGPGLSEAVSLDALNLLEGNPPWLSTLDKRWKSLWPANRQEAEARLENFLQEKLENYRTNRDFPSLEGTSRLSPYLRFGVISPYEIWHAIKRYDELFAAPGSQALEGSQKYLKELVWREFCHHLLFHFPDLHQANFNKRFDHFAWQSKDEQLRAWQRGKTGYPIIDAGMRELWQTGYMHNRVRMIAASFLVKHLRIDWRQGEAWFWEALVDGDPANNPAGWQWVAGSGADAAPYFRIFNPILQGQKFDAHGQYIRQFVPELARLPDKWLHQPWAAPPGVLQSSAIVLGTDYPLPLVDHSWARQRALEAFADLKSFP